MKHNQMTIAVLITTYKRPDGSTYEYLNKAIDSVLSQTYKDFKIYLIGDKYEDQHEFDALKNRIPQHQLGVGVNLATAKERDKYSIGSRELWCSGGVNARNHGMDIIQAAGIDYVCHLDHDDYWSSEHLSNIVAAIEIFEKPAFVYTAGYFGNTVFPYAVTNTSLKSAVSLPSPGKLLHSAACVDLNQIPLRYRDVFEEDGRYEPSDADMWNRTGIHILQNALTSVWVFHPSVYHPREGV